MHGAEILMDSNMTMLLKLVLAMLLGGLIGTERSVVARQAAGTRTFALVSLGTCLFIIVSSYVDVQMIGLINVDPLRLAAGVITGMGFIGGGLIIFRGDTIHGATTAAGLWVACAVGMAVGFGMYSVATFTSILALIVFTGMWYLEDVMKHWYRDHNEHPTVPPMVQ